MLLLEWQEKQDFSDFDHLTFNSIRETLNNVIMWTLSLEILFEASIDEMSLVATNEIKAIYGEKVRFRPVVNLELK